MTHSLVRLIATVATAALVSAACDKSNPVEPSASFSVAPENPVLLVGGSVALSPGPTSAAGSWSSSNTAVITVDDSGLASVVGLGTAKARYTNGIGFGEATLSVIQPGGSIRSGFQTTCGISASNSSLYCWGNNNRGQAGIGNTTSPQTSPAKVNSSLAFTSVSIGSDATCAMSSTGPYCWGRYAAQVIGDGSAPADPYSPVKVRGGEIFSTVETNGAYLADACSGDISCSSSTCALTSAGAVYCWNATWFDPRALVLTASVTAPSLKSLSVGMDHACGLTADHQAYCWGSNRWAQLAIAPTANYNGTPQFVQVGGNLRFQAISAGRAHTCAIALSGDAYCWGANPSGQLGATSSESCPVRFIVVTCRSTPTRIGGEYKFQSISASSADPEITGVQPQAHTCGVTVNQEIVCWGYNGFGQLGNGTTQDSETPAKVVGALKFRSVTTGFGHTCAVTTDGGGYCWGHDNLGQLGNASTVDSSTPVPVSGGLTFK